MKKAFNVKITVTAENDISGIYEYISHDNPGNEADFIGEIEEKIASLSQMPERGAIIPEAHLLQTQSYRHSIHKNFRIVYRVQGRNVCILRIFQGSKLLDIASLNE